MNAVQKQLNIITDLIQQGEFENAGIALDEALDRHPGNPEFHYLLGMLRGVQFRYHDALLAFRRTLELSPEYAEAEFEIGMIQLLMCRFNRAAEHFKRTQKRNYRTAETNRYLQEIKSVVRAKDATLSVCVIAKNEEKMLPVCLSSVQAIADEIVVVDTGSEDRTIEIAESFGAKVYYFEWQKDFSAAKNFCNDKATGDWILQLDADEELCAEDQNKVREVVHQDQYSGAFLALHNKVSNSFGEAEPSIHYLVRLYRNSPEIYYKNPVHEELVIPGEVVPVDVNVIHHGYNLDADYLREKRRRNAEILYKKLEKDPENVSTLFYLSMMHIGNREFHQAEDYAKQALARIPDESENKQHLKLMLLSNLAMVAVDRLDFKTTKQVADQAIAINPDYLDAHYYLGLACFNTEDLGTAKKAFATFIEKSEERQEKPRFALYADGSGTLIYQAYHFLGKIFRKQSLYKESLEHYSKAIELNPQFWIGYIDIGYVYMEMEDWRQAAHFLDQGIQIAKTKKDVNKSNHTAWFDLSNAVKNYFNVLKKLRSNRALPA